MPVLVLRKSNGIFHWKTEGKYKLPRFYPGQKRFHCKSCPNSFWMANSFVVLPPDCWYAQCDVTSQSLTSSGKGSRLWLLWNPWQGIHSGMTTCNWGLHHRPICFWCQSPLRTKGYLPKSWPRQKRILHFHVPHSGYVWRNRPKGIWKPIRHWLCPTHTPWSLKCIRFWCLPWNYRRCLKLWCRYLIWRQDAEWFYSRNSRCGW